MCAGKKWKSDDARHVPVPVCDGDGCRGAKGELRLFPIGPSGNMLLCKPCFDRTMAESRKLNKQGMDLPVWDKFNEGEVYGGQ